jgi:pilus assembly protein CpaF
MTIHLETLPNSVRNWAIENSATIGEAIDSAMDAGVESGAISASNEAGLRSELAKTLSGFGFLQPFLDDEAIEEVWVNRPGEIWFARSGKHEVVASSFSNEDLKSLIERMIRHSGRRLDRSTPFIDAQLESGFRLHAVIPDITREHLSLNIRKFTNQVLTMGDLVGRGVLSHRVSEYLVAELKRGANILISGATQAGKTTLLTALLSALDESERVVSVEDTFELRCLLPDWVAMQTRPASLEGRNEVDLRRLVKESLRMRPTRLVVGEVRGAESLDMLIALNSGIPGMCTIHANSSSEALTKLKALPLLAGGNISSEFLESVIRTSMQLFVHCSRNSDGSRQVESILRVADGSNLRLEEVAL